MDLKLLVNKSHVCLYITSVWRITLIETVNSKSNKVFYKSTRGKTDLVEGICGPLKNDEYLFYLIIFSRKTKV